MHWEFFNTFATNIVSVVTDSGGSYEENQLL